MTTKKKKSTRCPYIEYYKKAQSAQRQMYTEGIMEPTPYSAPSMVQEMEEMGMTPETMEEMAMTPQMLEQAQLEVMPMEFDYARAYVPIQYYNEAFPLREALITGTLFPELYQPNFYIKPIPK